MPLKLDEQNKKIAGVCGGLANHFEIDPTLVRVMFVMGFIFWGVGPILYLLLWLLMEKQ